MSPTNQGADRGVTSYHNPRRVTSWRNLREPLTSSMQKTVARMLFVVVAVSVLGSALGLYMVGSVLVSPQQRSVGDPPMGWVCESVVIAQAGGPSLFGWFVTGHHRQAGILLLHGVRSDRREMLGRAKFLNAAGYSVLLIDFRGHGETLGEQITFGYRESRDAHSALAYLRARVLDRPVGVIGVSMGGAAALLGATPIEADALVLESVYSSLSQAVKNRIAIRFGEVGQIMWPLLLWQVEPRLGIPLEALSPASAISRSNAPVLVMGGTEDRHTLPNESQALYDRAPYPKSLWMVRGASHQNLHQYAPKAYERRILEFFGKHLSS